MNSKKKDPRDPDAFINEIVTGERSVFSLVGARLHSLQSPSRKAGEREALQLRASLRQIAIVEPPPALQSRIWSQLNLGEVPSHEAARAPKQPPARGRRWATAGVAAVVIGASGAVTAQITLEPLRKQYAVMHEDTTLSRPFPATYGASGITARLDGLFGHDRSEEMRWRVTGRVTMRVFDAQTGGLLFGGQTSVMRENQADKTRALLGAQAYSHLMGLNPVADPRTPPALTVNDKGRVSRITGYGTFVVFDKWRFEIAPLPVER